MSQDAASTPEHWNQAYREGDTTRGWYQPQAQVSMELIRSLGVPSDSSILDVGAGASVLVDELLDAGYTDVTVLDHSPVGVDIARHRLGEQAESATWIIADLLEWQPSRTYDLWHDRAVLHFLVDEPAQHAYRRTLLAATHPESLIIIGVFSPDGPDMCAGLPVRRYSENDLKALLDGIAEVISSRTVDHVRPDGDLQNYQWIAARRIKA